jgi:hypothetical protein
MLICLKNILTYNYLSVIIFLNLTKRVFIMNEIQSNLFVSEALDPEQLTVSNSPIKTPKFNTFENISSIDIDKIKALDLTQFRNSNLPINFYWFLALPVVGWVALACLKINYVIKNTQAERIMRESQYDLVKGMDEKIEILRNVIKKSGPLAWQYQLELARLQLLNEDNAGADATLKEINKQRGLPEQTGWYNVRDKDLVSFEIARGSWSDARNVIKITHYTAEEAIMHASVHTVNGRLAAAYDSYNQAIYYDDLLKEEIRPCQVALAKKMQNENSFTIRALEIIEAETQFTARQKQAKEGEIERL